jgi:Na+/proline symporter
LSIFRTLVYIKFEDSFFDHTVREDHFAVPMLDPSAPFALINTTVGPLHLAVAISLVIFVFSFVCVSASPGEHPIAMLFVIEIISLILIAGLRTLGALPTALSVLETLFELTDVERSILPSILALPIRFSILVLSGVGVSILEQVCTLTVLEALLPLALVAIAILPCVYSVALGLRVSPLTYVRIT